MNNAGDCGIVYGLKMYKTPAMASSKHDEKPGDGCCGPHAYLAGAQRGSVLGRQHVPVSNEWAVQKDECGMVLHVALKNHWSVGLVCLYFHRCVQEESRGQQCLPLFEVLCHGPCKCAEVNLTGDSSVPAAPISVHFAVMSASMVSILTAPLRSGPFSSPSARAQVARAVVSRCAFLLIFAQLHLGWCTVSSRS